MKSLAQLRKLLGFPPESQILKQMTMRSTDSSALSHSHSQTSLVTLVQPAAAAGRRLWEGFRFLTALVLVVVGANLGHAQEEGLLGEGRLIRQLPANVRSSLTPTNSILNPDANTMISLLGPIDEATYLVGPGDVFYVAAGTETFLAPVGPDGSVLVEGIPPIPVAKKSLADAKRSIAERMGRYYKSGSIHVALSTAKTFQVSVTGAINAPGVFTVPVGATLSILEKLAGGVALSGSHRVSIHSADGKKKDVDLGAYYRGLNLNDNPFLSQGDLIVFQEVDYTRPLIYVRANRALRVLELEPGDNLQSVIRRAGNYKDTADWESANIYESDRLVETISRSKASGYTPKAGTTVEAQATKLKVFVSGTVIAPGQFDYDASKSTLDYMAVAGVTTNTGSVSRVKIMDSQGKVQDVNPNTFIPKPGDHIMVSRSFEAKFRDYVILTVAISQLAVAVATFRALNE
jgi:protein involved in polysaccharide export with SLBB domain